MGQAGGKTGVGEWKQLVIVQTQELIISLGQMLPYAHAEQQ